MNAKLSIGDLLFVKIKPYPNTSPRGAPWPDDRDEFPDPDDYDEDESEIQQYNVGWIVDVDAAPRGYMIEQFKTIEKIWYAVEWNNIPNQTFFYKYRTLSGWRDIYLMIKKQIK